MRIHRTTNRPQCSRPALDPDHDTLLATGVVPSLDDSLGKPACRFLHLHGSRVYETRLRAVARAIDILRSPFAFLFTRPQKEELIAEYVVREHHRGRSLGDILDDPYITNRCTPPQVRRVLERPEVIHAIGDDIVSAQISKV